MSNSFVRLKRLLAAAPLQVGDVTAVSGTAVTVGEPGGGVVVVRGPATVGQRVYFRDGVIEGLAPDLPVEIVEE